jgi:hypothetical protein
MSIMSSFFIAKSNLAAKKAPTTSVEATDITDLEVSNLDEIVTGVADRSLDAIETDEGDDATVLLLHPKFVAALAAANADALPYYAARWAQSDELADDAPELLGKLVALSRQAVAEKQRLYLRIDG